jgi:hypothetical protein
MYTGRSRHKRSVYTGKRGYRSEAECRRTKRPVGNLSSAEIRGRKCGATGKRRLTDQAMPSFCLAAILAGTVDSELIFPRLAQDPERGRHMQG